MKKILTLLMAIVVTASMMALPQVKMTGKKTKPVSHEQFEAKTPAQVKVKEMHKASLVERAAVRPTSAKKVVPATIAAPKKIANSVSEVISLHFDGFSVLPEWYEETGDWYMACADAEGWIVKFDILNPSYVGTFTTEDFDLSYSYIYTPDGGVVDYISIECTITEEKKSELLTVLSLEATIEGTDGNTYVVTCVQNFLVAKEVIENTISDATLEYDGYSEFVLAGKNEVLDLNLDVYATWPVGPFTKGEFNLENTKVLYNGVEQDLNNPELVVTTAVNEEGKAGYAANFSFFNQDTAQHVVEIFAPLAEPTDTVEIQMLNLQVDDSWAMFYGWVYYTAVDGNWDIYAGVTGFEAAEGTWSGEDVMLYVTNQQTGEATEAIYAKATVVEDEEKGWMATFEGVCVDGKYYVVNMHFEIPEPTKTVELRFENSAKASFYPDLGNDLMLSNDNGDYYIALDIYNVPMGSEFTLDQMDTYYTQLIDWNNLVEIQIADVQGVVYQRNDTTFMEAQVIGFDAVLYDVVLWHTVPTPSEVVELTVDAVFDNQIESQGYYTLHGQANESELLIAMSPITWEVEGTYVNDGMFGGFGAEDGKYDFYANYTYVAQPIGYDEYGDMQFDVYSVEKGTLTVTMDEEDNILAHASVICSNGVQYEIEMTSVFEKPHLQYDAEYGVERIYTTDDVAVAEYDADYGMALWQVTAADGSDLCALYFFIEEADAELVIPEGEYAINDSWDYGTVLASTGYDAYSGQVSPSLYASCDEEGYLLLPMWFMVDGTVTVKHVDGQLSIEVNALNSYDQEVHIVYEAPKAEQPEPTYTENKLNTYAFGLESELSEEALTVTYRLNNSNATSVNVLVYEGEEVVATVAGGTTIGKNTVSIAAAELPQGVQLTWGVEVNGTSVDVPTLEEKIYSFYHPSGVDIDNNPENATFGMLLVNEGMQKVKGVDGYVSTGYGAGIYAFTPSFDLLPNADQPGYNGGVEFTETRADGTGTAYAPRRIRISEDGRIFVTSLNTDGNYLWEVNPANMNEWTSIFSGELNENKELVDAEGNFVAAPNNGFDVKGAGENLQLAMYSVNLPGITGAAMSGFRLHEYNLGTANDWATAPSKTIVDGLYAINYTGTQVEYDNEGGVWIASYRGTANDANPGLVHINADGVEDAKLVWSNVRQAGIRFNNDYTKLVVAGNNGAAKKATIYSISKDANGAPVLTEETVIDMAVVGNNLNDFAWDYAGNLYSCGNSAEKLAAWAMPYSGTVVTPAAAEYAFQIAEPVEQVEMVGVVKRTLFNGNDVIVLTHEADGTAHIYNIVEGVTTEVSQEGVIAVDPENAGDFLAISDIAVTEDGKLVATNYMITQSADDQVAAGDKRGETRIYLWDDLAGAPSILFTSKMSSNWFQSKQGLTMAVKGTSDNMEIFMTGIHKSKAWARVSSYRVINGVYEEPAVNHNDHYYFYDINDAIALETTVGTQYELNASPLGEMNWVLDAELINPTEITEPETNNVEIATSVALTEDLGKKYNGASYLTVAGQALMVAPFANPDGELVGIEILNITNGFDAPQYINMLYLDEAVAAQAAATAVTIVDNTLAIALVVDANLYMFDYELPGDGGEYEKYEDEITNLVIDLDNLVLIGGPSTAFQVDVFLGLGEYNRNDDTYQLIPESSIAVMGQDATFIEGWAYEVDAFTPSAKAVVRCEWNGMKLEFHLTMTAAPMEATVVVVENAKVEIEEYLIWGDMYDYALTMTGEWINEADGLTYPVLVEVPVYYPEATEPSEIMSTVTVGGMGDNDPWLGFGEGTLTVTTETLSDGNKLVTATGIVQNPMAGVAIDITISGTITPTGVEDATVTVKPVKTIKNGHLIINKDGKEYNAQGAIVK